MSTQGAQDGSMPVHAAVQNKGGGFDRQRMAHQDGCNASWLGSSGTPGPKFRMGRGHFSPRREGIHSCLVCLYLCLHLYLCFCLYLHFYFHFRLAHHARAGTTTKVSKVEEDGSKHTQHGST